MIWFDLFGKKQTNDELIILCVLMNIFFCLKEIHAQSVPESIQTNFGYNWDASLNLFELRDIGEQGISAQLRRNFQKGGIRIAPSIGISRTTVRDSTKNVLTKSNNSGFGIRLGYEWQKQTDKHQLFYGADVSYSYSVSKTTVDPSLPVTGVFLPVRRHAYSLSVFAGVKYFLTPRMSLSGETHLYLSYLNNRNYSDFDFNGLGGQSSLTELRFRPLRNLNFAYYF